MRKKPLNIGEPMQKKPRNVTKEDIEAFEKLISVGVVFVMMGRLCFGRTDLSLRFVKGTMGNC